MPFPGLKALTVGVVATLILFWLGDVPAADRDISRYPSRSDPIRVDLPQKQILIYTEVNLQTLYQAKPHWGVVYQGGQLSSKAILKAHCTTEEFHYALIRIGAKPGNNLTLDSSGTFVNGDELSVWVTWPGLPDPLSLSDILEDSTGKGFRIRFGGNRQRAVEEQTGCLTCLESCPIGITSNAAYPAIRSWQRFWAPNSLFKGKTEILAPRKDGPIILIYQLRGRH
jgi:hypothetical protein